MFLSYLYNDIRKGKLMKLYSLISVFLFLLYSLSCDSSHINRGNELVQQWQLEDALEEFDGTLLVVSHDRYFLDNVVNRIFELEEGRITQYDGNYTAFTHEKALRREKEDLKKNVT